MEHTERGWAFIRRQCLVVAASICLGNRHSDTERQIPDECCEGKERGTVAGRKCRNKAVLF